MELTPFDILLLLLVIGGGVWGVATGAIRVIAPFTLLFALAAITHAYPNMSTHFGKTPVTQFFLVLFLFLTCLLVCGLLARALYTAVHAIGLGPVDRLLGLAFGLITGGMMAGLLVWWLNGSPASQSSSIAGGSFLAPSLLEFFELTMGLTEHILPQARPKESWWKW